MPKCIRLKILPKHLRCGFGPGREFEIVRVGAAFSSGGYDFGVCELLLGAEAFAPLGHPLGVLLLVAVLVGQSPGRIFQDQLLCAVGIVRTEGGDAGCSHRVAEQDRSSQIECLDQIGQIGGVVVGGITRFWCGGKAVPARIELEVIDSQHHEDETGLE